VYIGIHVQYRCYSCQITMILEFFRQFSEKYSKIKFHKNPSSGSWVVACGQADGQTRRC